MKVEVDISALASLSREVQITPDVIFSPRWKRRSHLAIKRLIDLTVSTTLLTLLSPVFVVLSIAVKMSSPGTIFYRWRVVGQSGRAFVGYKFRSMVSNADELKDKLTDLNEMTGPMFKITHDPRVTKVGHWMRRYSLDELPQFYSVLTGEMSLVGPRPPLVTEYAQFNDFQKQKLSVKPGITCLWQVNGRNSVSDFDDWVKLDLEYIREWSLWLDLKILLRTIVTVFSGSGK
jgi:lipopolysaccharide/colanic/teichoic acid biosynthesis glycosyltransferase